MLEKDSSVPLYNQLIEELSNYIQNNLVVGQKILSEREICLKYGVSRTTVRLALSELEELGYIYKKHGKGTFVSGLWQKMSNLSDAYSFTDQMRQMNKQPETKILVFETLQASHLVAEQLGIETNEAIYRIIRLRLADQMPMMYETTYLPVDVFPGLTLELLNSKPLYQLFGQNFLNEIKYADEEFYASLIKEKEAEELGLNVDDACLRIQRLTYGNDNRVIEYTLSVARSDQFIYKIRHARK